MAASACRRRISFVSRAAVPALAMLIGVEVPAGAAPIPADTTVEAQLMAAWPTTWSGMPASDAQFYKPVTMEAGVGLRLFMVKNEMLVSVPRYTTQAVTAGGVSTRQTAFIAGRGSYRCKKAILQGPAPASEENVNFCVSYKPDAQGFSFQFKYESVSAMDSRASYHYSLRFDIESGRCQVRLISGSMKTVTKTANYNVTSTANARMKSASCTLLDGKQTF